MCCHKQKCALWRICASKCAFKCAFEEYSTRISCPQWKCAPCKKEDSLINYLAREMQEGVNKSSSMYCTTTLSRMHCNRSSNYSNNLLNREQLNQSLKQAFNQNRIISYSQSACYLFSNLSNIWWVKNVFHSFPLHNIRFSNFIKFYLQAAHKKCVCVCVIQASLIRLVYLINWMRIWYTLGW